MTMDLTSDFANVLIKHQWAGWMAYLGEVGISAKWCLRSTLALRTQELGLYDQQESLIE